jgi:hypothetical protein
VCSLNGNLRVVLSAAADKKRKTAPARVATNAAANLGAQVGYSHPADLSRPPEHVDPGSGGAGGARSRAAWRRLGKRRR